MSDKLDAGDAFPTTTLRLVDGGSVRLPEDLDSDYAVVLFYRGHW